MWSHRAPRIVNVIGAVSRIITHVPHSLIAGCTSSTSIARATLPSLHEIDALPLSTHLDTGTVFYRHVDDIFQLSWAESQRLAASEAMVAFLCGIELPGQPSISAGRFKDLEDRLAKTEARAEQYEKKYEAAMKTVNALKAQPAAPRPTLPRDHQEP